MPTVPVPKYNGPQVAPAPLPGVRVGGGAPSFGQDIGQALLRVGLESMDIQYKREAVADATTAINAAKRKLDEWEANALKEPETAEPGAPLRFETVVKEFDVLAAQLREEAVKSTGNDLAKQTIGQTLSNYFERARMGQLDRAQKQKRAAYFATTLQEIDAAVQAQGVPAAERKLRIDNALGGAIAAGAIDADDAYKLKRKAEQDMEYGAQFARTQAAKTLPEATELRNEFGKFNPKLSPEQNNALLAQANARVAELDKLSDKAVEAQREDVRKMFQDAKARGEFTADMVQRWRSLLPADDYERAMHEASKAGTEQAEGQDDPDTSRRLLDAINRSYRDPAKLAKLRDQVANAALGYDPVTRTTGKPRLSRSTSRMLINDIDEFTNRIRAEARGDRAGRNEDSSRTNKERNEVEGIVRQTFKRFIDSRGTDGEKRQAQQRLDRELESLLRDGYKDPLGWLDKWKARSDDVVRARTPLPRWIPPQANGKPDFEAARRQLAEDFKARKPGVQTQEAYDARFRKIKELEAEYAQ